MSFLTKNEANVLSHVLDEPNFINQILARKLRADKAWEKVRIQAQNGQVKE